MKSLGSLAVAATIAVQYFSVGVLTGREHTPFLLSLQVGIP
jgi:hypothetical protein